MTLERDQAIHRDEMSVMEIHRLQEQVGHLTTAHQNCEKMLIHVMQ